MAQGKTTGTDLVRFLRAQLDEDESVARAAAGRLSGDDEWVHIARWDPARVLREVEAKRRIVDGHRYEISSETAYDDYDDVSDSYRRVVHHTVTCAICGWASDDRTSGCMTLRLLALAHADHPDYRLEWRP